MNDSNLFQIVRVKPQRLFKAQFGPLGTEHRNHIL